MKSTISLTRILYLTLIIVLFGASFGSSNTSKKIQPPSFTLLYSSNVLGEYEPCG